MKTFLIIIASIVFIGGAFLLTLMQPRGYVNEDEKYMSIEETTAILREAENLEAAFNKKREIDSVGPEDVENLRRAIALREKYMSAAGATDRLQNSRLLTLRTALQGIEVLPHAERLREIESAAEKAEAEGDGKHAISLYKEAFDLQSMINAQYPMSKSKDIQKTISYERKMRLILARPIYDESVKAEADARAAMEKQDWLAAQESLNRAIENSKRLAAEFPNTMYADYQRMRILEADLDSIKSAPLENKLSQAIESAQKAEEKMDFVVAAEFYAEAAQTQQNINKLYPKSAKASAEKFKELNRKREIAFSARFGKEILDQKAIMSAMIAKADYSDVLEISANLVRKIEQFRADFRESTLIGDELLLEVKYINHMVRALPEIREELEAALLPLPDGGGLRMYKTEIPQGIYVKIMQDNPSRQRGDSLPVESVIIEDAKKFCTRVEWISGYRAFLPTTDMYKKALGSMKYVDLGEISWNLANAEMKTHAVGTKKPLASGFYDILGNVSEIAVDKEGSLDRTVYEVGGNSQSTPDSLMDFPAERRDVISRSRMTGFRIVVEKPAAEEK